MNSLTGALLMLVLSLKLCLPLLINFSDRINPVVLEQSEPDEKKSESAKEDFKILSSYLISNQLQSVSDIKQFGAATQNPGYVNSHSFEVIVPPPDAVLSIA